MCVTISFDFREVNLRSIVRWRNSIYFDFRYYFVNERYSSIDNYANCKTSHIYQIQICNNKKYPFIFRDGRLKTMRTVSGNWKEIAKKGMYNSVPIFFSFKICVRTFVVFCQPPNFAPITLVRLTLPTPIYADISFVWVWLGWMLVADRQCHSNYDIQNRRCL